MSVSTQSVLAVSVASRLLVLQESSGELQDAAEAVDARSAEFADAAPERPADVQRGLAEVVFLTPVPAYTALGAVLQHLPTPGRAARVASAPP